MATTGPLPDQLIYLIIRFSASVSDLELPISSPRTTTTLSLKQLIRSNLPPSYAAARLRLIYAGKVLADAAPLSLSLKLPPPPAPRDVAYNDHGPGSKSKGKQPVRDEPIWQHEARRFYIHCSLGDTLSSKELASEAAQAHASETTLQKQHEPSSSAHRRSSSDATTASSNGNQRRRGNSSATAAPQGFDRLLSSGFTPAEVATLRSQFQSNLSFTHTPDTMPSASEMRVLEDRWLDSTATDPSAALTGETADAAAGGWGAGFSVEEGGLDDLFYGYLTGFFWPLGALIWGFREEGVWTRRRQLAVATGVLLNAAFGFFKWSS